MNEDGGGRMGASRRDALRRAALAAGGLAVAALAPSAIRPATARAQGEEEDQLREFLEQAVELEQASAFAYTTILEGPGLDAPRTRTLELLRDQEEAHANAWRSALDSLGFEPPDPPDSPSDAFTATAEIDEERAAELGDELERLETVEGVGEALSALAELEQRLIAGYLELAPPLPSEDLSRTSAEIAGSHAQHVVVLGDVLGEDLAKVLARLDAASLGGETAAGNGG